jgi:hypothetical protein
LESLSSVENACFKDSLKILTLNSCQVDENNLETIMLKIRPKFENLSKLYLFNNKIQSIHRIENKIKNNDDAEFVPSKSLRILDLYGNPIFKKMKISPEEKTAILSFLQSCSSIHNIGGFKRSNYGSDIESALRINHAGRSNLVKGGTAGSGDRRSLPLSMWPIVLVRAYENSYEIYDLVDTDVDVVKILEGTPSVSMIYSVMDWLVVPIGIGTMVSIAATTSVMHLLVVPIGI